MNDQPLILPPQPSQSELIRLLERYPIPLDENTGKPTVFGYGTAGFRYQASVMESIFVRVGILAAYRSAGLNGQAMGVMITASHNDESYNGVKLADPHGGMMAPEGEALAVKLANASGSGAEVLSLVSAGGNNGIVHVGRDTRSHSPALSDLTIRAARAMGATVHMHGVVTTPTLHYCVMMANPQYLPPLIPPRPNVVGYYEQLSHAYMGLLETTDKTDDAIKSTPIIVDCACGVGYAHTQRLNDALQTLGASRQLMARNAPDEGPLNDGCGSEHVQKQIMPPQWYSPDIDGSSCIPYAVSLDGDSDRIVFFAQTATGNGNNQFTLLDGDKIAVLICDFLQEQVSALETALSRAVTTGSDETPLLNLGVVQTAYANGASTQYLERVLGKDRVKIAKTGVKFVHQAAHDYFDVGVYFEANGHGTVLFGDAFYTFLAYADRHVRGHVALQRLQLLPALVNQAVGDALSDLLLVDAILQIKGWTIVDDWTKLYTDLPSRQCKVKVEDRTMIQTNENETRCTAPVQLQDALDEAIAAYGDGNSSRCFVRPSGTENVVRVYAEAPTPQQADELATQAAKLVFEICRGVGSPPVFPSSKM